MTTGRIIGYRLIKQYCDEPGCSERADIEITFSQAPHPNDDRFTTLARELVLGPIIKHYCAEHSPIDIEGEKRSWMKTLQTPPGAR